MEKSVDQLERRCPRLGGPISFHYCRTCSDQGSVCWKILDCWWEYFDVVGYLQECLSPEAFKALATAKPKPKVLSLLELIEQAQKR